MWHAASIGPVIIMSLLKKLALGSLAAMAVAGYKNRRQGATPSSSPTPMPEGASRDDRSSVQRSAEPAGSESSKPKPKSSKPKRARPSQTAPKLAKRRTATR